MHENGFAVHHAKQAVVLRDTRLVRTEVWLVAFAWHEDVHGVGIGVADLETGSDVRVQVDERGCGGLLGRGGAADLLSRGW